MFRALLCPSSEARDYDVDYLIGRFVHTDHIDHTFFHFVFFLHRSFCYTTQVKEIYNFIN